MPRTRKKVDTALKKTYRYLAYLDEDGENRLNKFIRDNYGIESNDAGTHRAVLMQLLKKSGY